MNKKTKYEIRNDQYPEKKNRKKGLVILLAVLLFTSSVGGAAVYSGIGAELWNGFASNEEDIDVNELSLVAKPETEEEGKEIADTSVPLASSLTEDETDLTPEGDPTPAGDSAQAGDSTPTRDLDADELTEELDELTTVMQAMVAAPAIPTVIVTTTTGGEESTTSSESDSTTETSTTTSKSDPAAEEAARKAIEEVARQAAAKLEEAKKIQIEINSLKSQLEGAKQTTLEKQKALENARIQYQNEIAAANKALAAAQDKALAFYNMKFEGLMTLYNLSRDSNSKVSEYFEKNSEISAAIDSEGFNYGKVITEDGTKKGSKSTTVAGASNGVTSNGDGGLNKVVKSTVVDTTATNPSVTYTLLDYKNEGHGAGFKIEQVKGEKEIWVKNIYWTEVNISKTNTGTKVLAYYIDCTDERGATLNTITMVVKEKEVQGNKVKYLSSLGTDLEAKRNCLGGLDNEIKKQKKNKYIDENTVTDNEDDKKIDMSVYNQKEIDDAKADQKAVQDAMNQAVKDEQDAIAAEQIIVVDLQKSKDAMVAVGISPDVATANGLDQGNAPADVATTTIATPEEIAAALPPANNLLQTATQQIGEPQPAGDPQPAANQQPAGDSQPAANQQAEGSQSEATTPTGDTKGNDESQPSEDAGSQNKEDFQNGTEDSESTGE